jgi:hypothetical protein
MRHWRKACCFAVLLLGCAVLFPVAFVYWERRQAFNELQAVLAEIDRTDPGWRLEDLEAARRVVPDDHNSALIVLEAHRKLPAEWYSEAVDELAKTPPPSNLPDTVLKQVRGELQTVQQAAVAARKLIDYPEGRFAIAYSPDAITTNIEHVQITRTIMTILNLDVHASLADDQIGTAFRSVLAMLNAGRAVGDEPIMMTQLVRMQVQLQSVWCMERVLGHGELGETELKAAQEAMDVEASQRLFLIGMRGSRAAGHRLFWWLADEAPSISTAVDTLGLQRPERSPTWRDRFDDFFFTRAVYRSHAWVIQFDSDVINAALEGELEFLRRSEGFDERRKETAVAALQDRDLRFAILFSGGAFKLAEAEQRADTLLDCARVAMATERFRLKHRRWPTSTEELTAEKLLGAVPNDRFNGRPLRMRRTDNGLVIFSAGNDGQYAGDALDRLEDFDPNQLRMEFRLWDPLDRGRK